MSPNYLLFVQTLIKVLFKSPLFGLLRSITPLGAICYFDFAQYIASRMNVRDLVPKERFLLLAQSIAIQWLK